MAASLLAGLSIPLGASAEPAEPMIRRVSVASGGGEARAFPPILGGSFTPSLSADGRYVAFGSIASNLVVDDTNGRIDIFVHDRHTVITERVSLTSVGEESRGIDDYYYGFPSISGEGSTVAFGSDAPDLVPGDTNDTVDIFVRDRLAGTTERVSVSSEGAQGDAMSLSPSLSADGRFVAYVSHATNLVADDTNEHADVFVHDRTTGLTKRASVSSDGVQANDDAWQPSISSDGSRIAFTSRAFNLVPGDDRWSQNVFVRDRAAGTTIDVSPPYLSFAFNPSLSADGHTVAYVCDPMYTVDVCATDLRTGDWGVVSVGRDGGAANDSSWGTAISADGRFVAFSSQATNLVAGDVNGMRDFFLRDRLLGRTSLVSVSSTGEQQLTYDGTALLGFTIPAVSADGRAVAFESFAPNLVPGDTNMIYDVFVYQRPDACPSGGEPSGPVSRRLRTAQAEPMDEDVERLNCDVIVGSGL